MLHLAPLPRGTTPGLLLLTSLTMLAAPRPRAAAPSGAAKMTLTSPAFQPSGSIPTQYTCDSKGVSPPLAWSGVPAGAKSLALIVDDPDAPDPKAPTTTWVHWVLYDVPPTATGLPEDVAATSLPPGTRDGKNGWKKAWYGRPCPPVGRHRYFFKLYALDTMLPDLNDPDKTQLEKAMHGHILAQTQLIGLYERSKK